MNQFKFKNFIWSTGDEKDKVTTPCLHSLSNARPAQNGCKVLQSKSDKMLNSPSPELIIDT